MDTYALSSILSFKAGIRQRVKRPSFLNRNWGNDSPDSLDAPTRFNNSASPTNISITPRGKSAAISPNDPRCVATQERFQVVKSNRHIRPVQTKKHRSLQFALFSQRIHQITSENSNERANRNLEFGAAVLQ